MLTLKQTEFTQTFGDEAFELGCSRTGDGTISYKVSDEKVIKVSDTGVVTIVGAGSATVTVSLSETEVLYRCGRADDYGYRKSGICTNISFRKHKLCEYKRLWRSCDH